MLLALGWPNHQFHSAATRRVGRAESWATCALTQLGFVRLSSNPAAVGVRKSPAEAVSLLEQLVADSRHVYVHSLPSPTAGTCRQTLERILGSQQVTDAYLLALAQHREAKLLTFDQRLAALATDQQSLEVLLA